MKEHAFDIETVENKDIVTKLPPPEIKYGNAKDPAKRAAIEEEAKKKQLDKLACSPLTGRVCCGAFYGNQTKEFQVIPKINDVEEIKILNWIFEMLGNLCFLGEGNDIIITQNGMKFDFLFIYIRAIILKMELPPLTPPPAFWLKRYTRNPHCDILRELTNWSSDVTGWNLDIVGRTMIGRGKTNRDYSTYSQLIEDGEGEKIGLDCLCDTGLTYDIYQMIKPTFFG